MTALTYLITTLFNLYLMVVILRVWLQLAHADFYNPFSQFIVQATNPFLRPLRRIIPGIGGIDWAGILFALVVAGVKALLLSQMTPFYPLTYVPIITLFCVIKQAGMLLFYMLLIRAILSWVSQGRSPIEFVMAQLTEPFLAPIRRIIPVMGGLDLSVLVLFILLNVINIFLSQNIPFWYIS